MDLHEKLGIVEGFIVLLLIAVCVVLIMAGTADAEESSDYYMVTIDAMGYLRVAHCTNGQCTLFSANKVKVSPDIYFRRVGGAGGITLSHPMNVQY